jgi:hypothetical protein
MDSSARFSVMSLVDENGNPFTARSLAYAVRHSDRPLRTIWDTSSRAANMPLQTIWDTSASLASPVDTSLQQIRYPVSRSVRPGDTSLQTIYDSPVRPVNSSTGPASFHSSVDLLSSHRERIAQLADGYKVPSTVFAESCPACDEIAMDNLDSSFVPRYPQGWTLVACRRHAPALKADVDHRHVFVGGIPEAKSASATRYDSRAAEKKAATAAIESSSSTCTNTHSAPSAPSPSPDSNGTVTPTTTTCAEKDPCPICVEEKPNLTLDCGHSFCNPCLTTWQQNFTDEKLDNWLQSSNILLQSYPILQANIKSRFTCPMCRTYLQHTKQSRRKRKMHNAMIRGEDWTEGSARTRRGGAGGNALIERTRQEQDEDAMDICDEAPSRMPVVYRT